MKKTTRTFITAGWVALLLAPAALGQTELETIRRELAELKKGQEEIRKELGEISKMLAASKPATAPAAAPTPRGSQVGDKVFDLGENPVKGASTAKLTLVEFTDYQ